MSACICSATRHDVCMFVHVCTSVHASPTIANYNKTHRHISVLPLVVKSPSLTTRHNMEFGDMQSTISKTRQRRTRPLRINLPSKRIGLLIDPRNQEKQIFVPNQRKAHWANYMTVTGLHPSSQRSPPARFQTHYLLIMMHWHHSPGTKLKVVFPRHPACALDVAN